jgi:prepilin-type N-terminal cleavage/methylation domain-containing protein
MESRNHGEAGFTMVEILVAILIVAIASLATFALLSDATRNAQRAKASQVAVEYAEQELEYLRSLKYTQLAMTTAPTHSSNTESPNYRVFENTFALRRSPVGDPGNMVLNGTIDPGPTEFSSGDVTGKIYRYIVWHNDESCLESVCPGERDYKQIVVVVKLNTTPSQAAETGYFEVQSNFVDPTKNSGGGPLPDPGEGAVTAQQFFLSDTPCAATGTTVRQEIVADHPLHNTLGECAAGPQTGSTPGAPDALLLGSPPDPAPEDPTIPVVHQYSNDLYTEPGLQLVKEETSGCNNNPSGATNPASQIHRWVTDPMTETFVLSGRVTLEIFTRTLNETFYNAGICMYLFDSHKTPTGQTESRYFTNVSGGTPFWSYIPADSWPREWTSVRRTLELSKPEEILAGDRLGLAISTEREATQAAKAISIMYDHPGFPSRIEVDTRTPIKGG